MSLVTSRASSSALVHSMEVIPISAALHIFLVVIYDFVASLLLSRVFISSLV
jgi:hypothetical protein